MVGKVLRSSVARDIVRSIFGTAAEATLMSERVAVTGSSGHLGRAVVDDLVAHGYEVVGIDRVVAPETSHPTLRLGRACRRTAGAACSTAATALIHLAAIPAPVGHPPEVVFANNTQATYAALEAAGDGGDHAGARSPPAARPTGPRGRRSRPGSATCRSTRTTR